MDRNGLRLPRYLGSALLVALAVVACGDRARLPNYDPGQSTGGESSKDRDNCSSPAVGCQCSEPGAVIDCGEVKSQIDGYVTCMQGSRLCRADRTWGTCDGTSVSTKKLSTSSPTLNETQSLGVSHDCSAVNPCDPLCREIVDTGTGLASLPDYMCSTGLGLSVCNRCGYERVTTLQTYGALPSEWRVIPWTCTTEADNCLMDTHCVAGSCVEWAEPCQVADGNCGVDLTVGRPCVSAVAPEATFHIPICNRGRTRLDSGTIRIGVDSRSGVMNDCMPSSRSGFPDSGVIEFPLSSALGRFIDPGRCLDINAGNSHVVGLTMTGNRAIVVNMDAGIAECNSCNNTNTINLPAASGGGSVCETCSNLSCAQSNPDTTVRGVVFDPAGRTVIPNVTVYVPNTEATQIVSAAQVSCDTCESLISGTPIAITQSDAAGRFTLRNVPANVPFPLVIQSGRWRRQVTIGAIDSGATRWVGTCSPDNNPKGNASASCTVDETEPASVPEMDRLRFPRTQRRCSQTSCAGEGDIPKMALIMGDGDPMQCLLRRIGIAESEMTAASGSGRIHLFNHNGMQISGGQKAFGADGLLQSPEQLRSYAALLAPCDYAHDKVYDKPSADYGSSLYGSGPSYNSPPNPTASEQERRNVREYLDAGGRLFTTHWLSMDFVHLNYSPPEMPRLSTSDPRPFLSPLDPESNGGFKSDLGQVAGLGLTWAFQGVSTYNPTAPVVHLFGRNIEATGNTSEPLPPSFAPVYPHFDYTIDQSSGNRAGVDLATWAAAVGATTADNPGKLRFHSWSPMVRAVRPELGVTRLAYGDARDLDSFHYEGTVPASVPRPQEPCLVATQSGSTSNCSGQQQKYWGDEHVALFQFDTPLGSATPCGRAVVAQSHVTKHACSVPSMDPSSCPNSGSNSDCSCVTLPAASEWSRGCGDSANALAPLQPEELAFEYLLFSATQCLGEMSIPPAPSALPMRTFSRIFHADCGRSEQVVWQLFSLQATIPNGTAVYVAAKTADTEHGLANAKWVNPSGFESTTTTWTSCEHTLDWSFRNQLEPAEVSREWLEVILMLKPDGTVSPTVSEWRMIYNCVASE